MVRVTVILPDGRKGQVEVDPRASRNEVKKAIVSDLKLGKPESFLLAVAGAPESEDMVIGNIELRDGDIVFIIDVQASRGVPIKLNPDDFK